jgi:hypothetical protein
MMFVPVERRNVLTMMDRCFDRLPTDAPIMTRVQKNRGRLGSARAPNRLPPI